MKASYAIMLGVPWLFIACDSVQSALPDNAIDATAIVDVSSALSPVRSITPARTDTAAIARISGFDSYRSDRFLIADVSEADVKVFSSSGPLIARLGRKGSGPEEFQSPRYARFIDADRIVVADAELMRLTWWHVPTRTVTQTTRLAGVATIMGFVLVNDTVGLLSGTSEDDSNVLTLIDLRSGEPIRRFLPIRDIAPPALRSFLWFHLTSRGDTAYVVATVSDSLWTVHLPSLRVTASSVAPVGYLVPTHPGRRFSSIAELTEWGKQFHTAAPAIPIESAVAVPFVQGVLNYGDPMILSVLTRDGVVTVENAPPIIGSIADQFVAIGDPLADTVSLQLLRWSR